MTDQQNQTHNWQAMRNQLPLCLYSLLYEFLKEPLNMETQTGTMIQGPPLINELKKQKNFAVLEKDFASKMTLKKTEFELKRKELEMEMQLFEEEGALKLEYEKEALDARASDSDDSAAPSIRSRSPFNWKTSKNKDVSRWLDNSDKFSNLHDYSFERAKIKIDSNYHRVSFNRKGVLMSCSPSGERASAAR